MTAARGVAAENIEVILPASKEAATRDELTGRLPEGGQKGQADADATTLLTTAQLAERWQVPVRTIYAWAKRNKIPHYRAGRLLRFDPGEVEEHFRGNGFAEHLMHDTNSPGESAFALLTA